MKDDDIMEAARLPEVKGTEAELDEDWSRSVSMISEPLRAGSQKVVA